MRKEMNRNLVTGYLQANGRNIINGNGDPILLNGWGLGNWLLCEGYMWLHGESNRLDRPRRIEEVVRELTGSEFSRWFWKEFRAGYTAKEDVKLMAELGYNSVRIPFNWRILLEDEPGLRWIEEGFTLLDNCIDWCEEYGLYAFLDMHGAPGGQTGANIDDSVDDMPRLFTDKDSWDKGVAIWEKLARRYAGRWIVGGYDLLNEPIRPERHGIVNCDHLVPELARFYEEATAAIRKHDAQHMLSIEGHRWATKTDVFYKRYDDNMCIHFHRYACMPDTAAYREYLEASERLDLPLWLGETAENSLEWYAAMFPLSADLGIGYNLWPWKKMGLANSPLTVKKPDGWDRIIEYAKGGPRPSYEESQAMLRTYLDNIKAENCVSNLDVTQACLRQPGFTVRGTDFDHFPGRGVSHSGTRGEDNLTLYRRGCGMRIRQGRTVKDKRFPFECGWDSLTLEMAEGEFAVYSAYDVSDGDTVVLELSAMEDAVIEVSIGDDVLLGTLEAEASADVVTTKEITLPKAEKAAVKIRIRSGRIELDRVIFAGAQ